MTEKPDLELKAMESVYNALKELENGARMRVIRWVQEKLGQGNVITTHDALRPNSPPHLAMEDGTLSPKAFLGEKRPQTDIERITCLAYYLAHYRKVSQFKTRELTDLNKEAAQPPLSNPSYTVVNATNSRYLAPAGGGRKQITIRGEDLVQALPDRERVAAALEATPLRARKRPRRNTIS